MIARTTALAPFPHPAAPATGRLAAHIGLAGGRLEYRLSIAVPGLAVPPPGDGAPGRRHGLWRRTCAELFIGVPSQPGYLEWNLSPAGHWNLYRFDGYREGGREALEVEPTVPVLQPVPGGVVLAASLPLGPLGLGGSPLELAACAVVETRDGTLSHWAPLHPAARPDFHDRRGFVIRIPAPGPRQERQPEDVP